MWSDRWRRPESGPHCTGQIVQQSCGQLWRTGKTHGNERPHDAPDNSGRIRMLLDKHVHTLSIAVERREHQLELLADTAFLLIAPPGGVLGFLYQLAERRERLRLSGGSPDALARRGNPDRCYSSASGNMVDSTVGRDGCYLAGGVTSDQYPLALILGELRIENRHSGCPGGGDPGDLNLLDPGPQRGRKDRRVLPTGLNV